MQFGAFMEEDFDDGANIKTVNNKCVFKLFYLQTSSPSLGQ
jgi:hypothetical protein